MIFTSLGLLVVATVLLVVGIVKSSVAMLTLSVVLTLAAIAVLYASFVVYRKKAGEEAGAVRPGYPGSYAAAAAPPANGSTPVVAAPPAVGAPAGATLMLDRPALRLPVPEWDSIPEDHAAALTSTLNLDELHDVRRHEIEHEARPAVLAAIDERISAIVALRRGVSAGS